MKKLSLTALLLLISLTSFSQEDGYDSITKNSADTGVALSELLPVGTKIGKCVVTTSKFVSSNEYKIVIRNSSENKSVDFRIKNEGEFLTVRDYLIVDSKNEYSDSSKNYVGEFKVILKESMFGEMNVAGLSIFLSASEYPQDWSLINAKSITCGKWSKY